MLYEYNLDYFTLCCSLTDDYVCIAEIEIIDKLHNS